MEGMECMGVYGSVWESTWVHINVFSTHEFMWVSWVYVTVRNFCDCHECMWVNVRVMIVFECIWLSLRVWECMWVYVSVFECLWILWVYLSVVWTLTLQLFRNHIQNFAITTAPPFKLTCQDSGYLPGLLLKLAYESFQTLQNHLGDEPTLAFPRADQAYILVTNAFTPTLTLPGGLCATLVQKGAKEETQIILHTSRRINSRRIKKITHPFYLRQQPHEFMWLSWVFVSVC